MRLFRRKRKTHTYTCPVCGEPAAGWSTTMRGPKCTRTYTKCGHTITWTEETT